MSRAPRTTPPAEPPAPTVDDAPNLGAFSPRALVELLFSKAGPKLARADLLAIIKGGSEFTENGAGHAAAVLEGLGCLVLHDASNGPGAGNFQDGESVVPLLWHLQAHFEALEGMSSAVAWAASELSTRGNQ